MGGKLKEEDHKKKYTSPEGLVMLVKPLQQ